ncbi:MAG: hypothetical protein ACE5JF_11985 [Anaerolineales bacterium]
MSSRAASESFTIAIVGPCASGKTTLARGLEGYGIRARQVVQEHSYVPRMWQIIAKPDLLIYLEASFQACSNRKHLNWGRQDYDEQLRRLTHARENFDILVETDMLSESAVLDEVLSELRARQVVSS